MASPQRLLLQALLSGLGDAVGRNDEAAADRCHTRIRLIARQHFATNPSISAALERLLSASAGGWRRTWPNALKRSSQYSNTSSVLRSLSESARATFFLLTTRLYSQHGSCQRDTTSEGSSRQRGEFQRADGQRLDYASRIRNRSGGRSIAFGYCLCRNAELVRR